MEIHIFRDGEQWGPYSIQEINEELAKGVLSRDVLAWHEGLTDWTPIQEIYRITLPREPIKVTLSDAEPSSVVKPDPKVGGIVFSMKGVQDLLEVFEDNVTITPKGVLGFLNKGMKGAKEIPFASIIAVQFKEAGALFSGYIQFTIPGGNESKGGLFAATQDENTFVFAETKNNPAVREIKEYIDSAIKRARMPQYSSNTASLSDELQKLAQLMSQGILSEAEFQSAKRKLIG
jgi:hypothetical protein